MTDHEDTPIKSNIQILKGQSNYHTWTHSFKPLAMTKGIWALFNSTEEILNKPRREEYLPAPARTPTAHDTPYQEPPAVIEAPAPNITIQIALYRLALDEYTTSEKRVTRAMLLLKAHLDPAISEILPDHRNPHSAWRFLEEQYSSTATVTDPWTFLETQYTVTNPQSQSRSRARVLNQAMKSMAQLHRNNFTNMHQYLNRIKQVAAAITAAGGIFDDDQMKSKTICGLPMRYNIFVELYYLLLDVPGVPAPSFEELSGRLLRFEEVLGSRPG